MRELLYLSRRKLHNFFFFGEAAAGTWTTELQVKIPLVMGRLGLAPRSDPAQVEQRKLERIIRHLDRQAVDWTDEDGAPGTWVRFDMSMGFAVFEEYTGTYPVVLFAGSTAPEDGRAAHLLLCGSPVHLMGSGFQRDNYWASQGRYLDQVAESLDNYDSTREYEGDSHLSRHIALSWPEHERILREAYLAAARESPQRTRAHLSGLARVLVRTKQDGDALVAATPLYVQYGELPRPRRFLRR